MRVIKFIFHCCFTKKIFIVLIAICILLCSLFIGSLIGMNETLPYDEVILNYTTNALYYTKIVITLFSCYVFASINNHKCLFAINFVASSRQKKSQYLFSCIIINCILIILLFGVVFLLYLIIGIIIKKYFFLTFYFINSFVSNCIIALYYGLVTLFLTLILKNQIGLIFSFLLFILSDLLNNDESLMIEFFKFFLPNYFDVKGFNLLTYFSIVILTIFILIIIKMIFNKNDLNY